MSLSNRPRLAPIERLPIELLHRIFFDSLEFNLPRASLPLATALSSQVVYTWLIRLAFSSDNPSSRRDFFIHPFLPLHYHSLDASQRADLQTEILKCRWCTVSLIRRCQRDYVGQVLARKCADLVMSDEDAATLKENMDHGWDPNRLEGRSHHGVGGKGDLVISTQERDTGHPQKLAIWFNAGAAQIREPSPVVVEDSDVFRMPYCNPSKPCRMPERLLSPPWTDEKLGLLSLFSTQAYIDEDDSSVRSRNVLRQVIEDRDFATFERLLSLQIRVKVYAYPLRWPVRGNHFRLAARHAEGDDDPFLRLLFVQRRDEIPPNDWPVRNLMSRYDHHPAT